MSVEAIARPTLALARARTRLKHILKHVARLRLKLVVVVGTAEGAACAFEVEVVARLLFLEARVVDGPFLLTGRAHVGV